ncbi:hypothetical protein AMTRI_Chr07g78580 [Amborella trichopoda]|uniref:uncharacterized protein LOC105421187 isoform X2 n=1 Tax=Amborella trichopoda TaxID=13333 RepID=UPI0005D3660F|nr:uncharacterized protein LOC105421187 isoform X2 [Amborella trichopoda]|eukprot:XP_011625903.1 uncharacterized protein LOC105421187 isoform X2 [Amborella trichopoda]
MRTLYVLRWGCFCILQRLIGHTSERMRSILGGIIFKTAASLRQLEQDMETVIKVLQPGPLGIVKHKFSDAEIHGAKVTIQKALENWQRNSHQERISQADLK